VAQRDRLQSREPLAAAGAAGVDREMVADQLAAAVGEDRRTAHQTCALLLVAAGGASPDPAALCRHAGEDRGAAVASGISGPRNGVGFGDAEGRGRDRCVRILPKNSGFGCFGAKARQNRPVEAPWRAFGFKTALELCVCKPLGVGSSLNQDSKWKFRVQSATI
jgi:hypothetical protein